uniref:Uncharacterized protein n=1 Tax=mine drainage metagenome TaxID=410659 RepID=E6PUT7_9ZZZZ
MPLDGAPDRAAIRLSQFIALFYQ